MTWRGGRAERVAARAPIQHGLVATCETPRRVQRSSSPRRRGRSTYCSESGKVLLGPENFGFFLKSGCAGEKDVRGLNAALSTLWPDGLCLFRVTPPTDQPSKQLYGIFSL